MPNGTNNNIPTQSYVVAELRQIGGGDHDVGLFGIFDGAMNYQTPAYLQSYLFKNPHDEWMLVSGNSRAIICCKNGMAKQLSVNHDLLNKMERGARKQRVSYLLITRHFELFVDTDKVKENI